eukprot:gene3808-4065_t
MTCQAAVQNSDNSLNSVKLISDQPLKHQPCSIERCAGGFELAPGEVHPWHKPSMPSHETIKSSPAYPVVITPNPMVKTQVIDGTSDPQYEIPVNQGLITISSSLFEGSMEIHLRGLSNTKQPVFDGKKRFFQIMCQGRFKRPVPASSLCMGQEFVKPGNAPPWVGELVFTAAAKVFSNSTQVDAYATLPYFMNPLLAACQLVNVSRPGSAPPMAAAQEDMRLFSPALADKNNQPLTAAKRRKWCDQPKNLEGLMLDTENVYTFHIWQHLIDFSTYKLSVGNWCNIDLAAALNGQPLQLTVYDTAAKEHLVSMLVWHERLLYGDSNEGHASVQHLSDRITRLSSGFKNLLSRK